MKRILILLAVVLSIASAQAAEPLRVFIRGGKKSHGPEAHEHARFLEKWQPLLTERGMKVDGALEFPTEAQLDQTDVLVMYAQDGGNILLEQRPRLEKFIKRGGGIVVIHTASVANKPDMSPYWKSIIGGSWVAGQTKWKEGPMDLYYVESQRITDQHPITKGAANFKMDDEIYYDMDISPDVRVLATSYTPNVKEGKKPAAGGKANIYDIQPQMWTYERVFAKEGERITAGIPYRVFVSIPGHMYDTFARPNYRAILLRGIAWAGKRANLDEFCKPEEIAALTYPEGGPQKPADTLKALEIHPDFKLTLVASEPLISKPMNFDWAPDGSLWVAETPEYPNGRRGMRPEYRGKEWKDHGGIDPTPEVQDRKAIDKISRLTDTNGDGVMDKKEVFYEGLDLVTGLVFHKDGVIVTQAPDILWLRDTNGDGKADKVEKLFTGLGTSDTHAVINNPRWGWDGWIYATHGYSSSDKVLNAKGEKQGNIGSGVVRFRPDGSVMEQYSSKGGNTWGLQITGDNRVMWTQPTSGTILEQVVLPEYALARGRVGKTPSYNVVIGSPKTFPAMSWEQMAYVQIDFVGSFTATAGCAIYDGGTWPAEYNGDYFTTEPTINIIHHERLTPKGASYTGAKLPGREDTEFIRSKDMWWRPIEARVGPDGAVYIGDFYNQAVIHNDTRGPDHNKVNAAVRPDRDHYFGRIWRLDHKDAKKIAVPDLSKAGVAELVKAIEHPNRAVRMNAARLLLERPNPLPPRTQKWREGEMEQYAALMEKNFGYQSLLKLALDSAKPAESRVAALWVFGQQDSVLLLGWSALLADKDPIVRRNAANLAERYTFGQGSGTTLNFVNNSNGGKPMAALLSDSDASVRLAALRALGTCNVPADDMQAMDRQISAFTAEAIVAAWPKFDDDFQKSAAVGALAGYSGDAIPAILKSGDASLAPIASILVQGIGEKNDANAAAKLVVSLASAPATADALKRSILDTLGKSLKDAPAMTPELSSSLAKLLASGASGSVLPLAAKWDKTGALKGEVAKLTGALLSGVANAAADDTTRLAAAQSLIGLRSTDATILPTVVKQLAAPGTPGFKRALIAALGETDDASVGATLSSAYGKLPGDVQPAAFDAVLKRADWALAFLDAVKAKTVDVTTLGPTAAARLRTHPNKNVAERANEMLNELNPMAKAKKDAIAKLMPIVEGKGDIAKGKAAFTTTCAICHKFGDAGADVGPALTGMGSHGAGELLTAIVDPNAEVDPSFAAWNLETKDGQFFAGIIAAENPASLTIKSLAGVQEVKVAALKSRVNTGRSLMPEGFEGLGGETLRDIIAYMQSVDGGRFRTIDLRDAFTTTTALGLYADQNTKGDSFVFNKTGTVNVGGIPFNIVPPEKAPRNIIVLKGGPSLGVFGKTMPQRVEVKVGGFKANRLHFLGGVTGWGFQNNGETSDVMKITIHTTQGQREAMTFKNGVEFSDYYNRVDVPGSKFAEGVVKNHQMRWFSKPLALGAVEIDRITIESLDGTAVPTLVAITAELADPNAKPLPAAAAEPAKPQPAASADAGFKPQFDDAVPQPPATRPANGPRVLLVGGGSSHDFVKFFGASDKATLTPAVGWVDFTQNLNGIAPILKNIDVLVLSANQPISSETKKALIDYANAGGGIVALHPGTWYAWGNFPQWNKEIIGGGTKGHDSFGPFTVTVTNAASPITKGVPATFEITDELYNYIADPAAAPVEVLATATSPKTGKTFPQVWIVKHPKAKIVGLTLGHDAKAHDLPAYQALLKNAVSWAGAK